MKKLVALILVLIMLMPGLPVLNNFGITMSSTVRAETIGAFNIATIPNNTLKLGDDFFDMNSDAMNDSQATILMASLLKDGINKNKAYFKFGGLWYAPFELSEQQFLNPAYALNGTQLNAIRGFNKWYKSGNQIVNLRPGAYTIAAINQFSSSFRITTNNLQGAEYFNVYKKSSSTLINSTPIAINNSLNSMPIVYANINDLEVWLYSDAAGTNKLGELLLEGSSNEGILDWKEESVVPAIAIANNIYITGKQTLVLPLTGENINPATLAVYDFKITNGTDFITPIAANYTAHDALNAGYSNGFGVITLTTQQEMNSDGTYTGTVTDKVKVYTVDAPNTADLNGNKLKAIDSQSKITVQDRCRPSASVVTTVYTSDISNVVIKVKVDEALAAFNGTITNANSQGQFSVIVNGSACPFSLILNSPNELLFNIEAFNAVNKAYNVTFTPIASTNIVDTSGVAPNVNNTNALKPFSFTGTVNYQP